MSRGKTIALKAMKKEFNRLCVVASKVEKEVLEAMQVGTEMINIHNDFVAIVKSKETGQKVLDKLDLLKKRSTKADKIRKKDLVKLFDKENKSKMDRDDLAQEISMMEYKMRMQGVSC